MRLKPWGVGSRIKKSPRLDGGFISVSRGELTQILLKQPGGEVALSGVAADADNFLTGILGTFGVFHRRVHIATCGDPEEDSFFAGAASGHLAGFLFVDLDDIVHHIAMVILGNEARADSLNFVGARISPAQNRRSDGFERSPRLRGSV
jgi:hypothetical protein